MKFLGQFLGHPRYGDNFGPFPVHKNKFDDSGIPYEVYNNVTLGSTNPDKKWCWALDLSSYLWGPSSTTIEKALHFALYSGFKKLIIVGCDCTAGASHLLPNWKYFKFFIENYYPDVQVELINPVRLIGLFPNYKSE